MTADVIAGVTLAAVAIPECMGYTKIVGTPVVTGLYTLLLPAVAFAWIGSSRHLVVAADSATAAILFAGLFSVAAPFSPHWLALTSAAALETAVLVFVAALLRLGFLADFLSRTVLVGFLSGVGVSLALAQLPEMLGVTVTAHGFLPHLLGTLTQAGHAQVPTVVMAAGVLAIIVGIERWSPRVPGALIGVALAIAATWALRLDRVGLATVGGVQAGLPSLSVPHVTSRELVALMPTVASMFLVIVAQSAATSRSFAQKYGDHLNEDRDLFGLAAANAVAGLSGTFVVNGSPTKTAIADAAGARSQVAQLTTAVVVVIVLLAATALIAWTPVPALAALVFLIGLRLVDLRELRLIYRFRKATFAVAIATLASVVVLGVERGMFVAIILSLLDHLRQEYRPKDVILTFSDGNLRPKRADRGLETVPGLVVYRFDAPLFFANADHFAARVQAVASAAPHPVRWFVFDLVSIVEIDYTGGRALATAIRRLQESGVLVGFAEIDEVQDELECLGIIHGVAPDRVFESVILAIEGYRAAL